MKNVFNAAAAMTALVNQLGDGADYNNFDEMIVHRTRDEINQTKNHQKQPDTNEECLPKSNRKRAKKTIVIDNKTESDEDGQHNDDDTDNDDNYTTKKAKKTIFLNEKEHSDENEDTNSDIAEDDNNN